MASKISLAKLTRYKIRQSTWLPILIGIVALFLYPVRYAAMLAETERFAAESGSTSLAADKYQAAVRCIGASTFTTAFVAAAAAILCAAVSFYYLHNKEQTNFYHSLSIKRLSLLWTGFWQGWLSAVIPYTAAVLIALFGIGAAHQNVTAAVVGHTFISIAVTILGFSAIYAFCILAMLLSGKLLTGIVLMVFLCFFGPCVYYIMSELAQYWFSTVVITSDTHALWLSPVTVLAYSSGLLSGDIQGSGGFAWQILALGIYLAAALYLSVVIAKRRPSETVGTALTYPKLARVLKVLITVPAALGLGLFLTELFNTSRVGWAFCCILFAVILGGCIEFLFYADLHMALKHWRSQVVSLGLTSLVLVFFLADPLGVNTWIPDAGEVNNIMLEADESLNVFGDFCQTYYNYVSSDAEENDIRVDTKTMLPLIEENLTSTQDEENYYAATVTYHMKNGRTHHRRYYFPAEEIYNLLAKESEDKAWREAYYPLMKLDAKEIHSFYLMDPITGREDSVGVVLSKEEREELAAALREDAAAVSLDEIHDEQPLFSLQLEYENYTGWEVNAIYVYPEYTRTIAFLKSKGYTDEDLDFETRLLSTVLGISITYDEDPTDENYVEYQMYFSGDTLQEIFACTEFVKDTLWNEMGEHAVSADVQTSKGTYYCLLKITNQARYNALKQKYGTPGDK